VEWAGDEAREVTGLACVEAGLDESEYDMDGAVELNELDEFGGGSIRSEWEGGGGIADELRISSTDCR
jgi:hypothetical protein